MAHINPRNPNCPYRSVTGPDGKPSGQYYAADTCSVPKRPQPEIAKPSSPQQAFAKMTKKQKKRFAEHTPTVR